MPFINIFNEVSSLYEAKNIEQLYKLMEDFVPNYFVCLLQSSIKYLYNETSLKETRLETHKWMNNKDAFLLRTWICILRNKKPRYFVMPLFETVAWSGRTVISCIIDVDYSNQSWPYCLLLRNTQRKKRRPSRVPTCFLPPVCDVFPQFPLYIRDSYFFLKPHHILQWHRCDL